MVKHMVDGVLVETDSANPPVEVQGADPATFSGRVTPLEFMARFTEAESMAITTAAMKSPPLLRWYLRTAAGTYIDLLDPLTVEGVRSLVNAGLLRPSRADAILTP